MSRGSWYAALALTLLLAASGCKARMVKVEGTVTLDGAPLEGATISFVPENGAGPSAAGFTGSDGVFTLTTHTTGDGVREGTYNVIITKSSKSTAPLATGASSMKDNWKEYLKKEPTGPPKAESTVPAQYSDPAKPVLKCKVPPDGPVEFKLRSKGGA